jgi:hypothetical protein
MSMAKKKSEPQFLLCVDNHDYPASLEVRKVYRILPDAAAAARGFARVIDESGEDYLYLRRLFVPIEVPAAAADLFPATADAG